MKKILTSAIAVAIGATSMVIAAHNNTGQIETRPADLDSIYRSLMQSSHEVSMMRHGLEKIHAGELHVVVEGEEVIYNVTNKHGNGVIVELKEIGETKGEIVLVETENEVLEKLHVKLMAKGDHKMPKLTGPEQDKLDQLAEVANALKAQIRDLHNALRPKADGK